jgi:hypothetical protein
MDIIKIIKLCIKHFITICRHKYYVGQECFKLGLYYQGIVHDLSKFSPTEFISSAIYFQGDKTPIEVEKAEKGYSLAWLNHKSKNKHHWDYWIDFKEGKSVITIPIPDKYIKEMFCDFIGASKAYNKDKFNSSLPYEYFKNNCHKMIMDDVSMSKLRNMLKKYEIDNSKLKIINEEYN